MKRHLMLFLACAALGAGCASDGARTAAPKTAAPAAAQEAAPVPAPAAPAVPKQATAAVRRTAETYTPGVPLEVVIAVAPVGVENSLMIVESVPSGWTVVKSDPPYMKRDASGYRWLKWNRGPIEPFEIRYEVEPPAAAKEAAEFAGVLKFNSGPERTPTTVAVGGRTSVRKK